MNDLDYPHCGCSDYWTEQGHHPECPVRRRFEELERENAAMREAIKEAHEALKELRSFYIEMTNLPPCLANAVLTKLQPFLTDPKQ